MRNPGSFLMNRLGIHINLFQLFVMSTTHFSSPALQFVFYVLWNPRNSHIRGRERVTAEIIVTLRKSLNLARPLYSRRCGGRGSEPNPLHCVPGGGQGPTCRRRSGLSPAWKCFIYNFHNGGFQGRLKRVMGDELGF